MLSRNAEGLYWMGRYLERAEHLSRLLLLQIETLVDRPLRDIDFGWTPIYGQLDRAPLVGALEPSGTDDLALADSYTLADDLTFERANPDSVRNCLAAGRENARQMRHCISAEMWSSLNLTWLRVRDVQLQDIWKDSPEGFYIETVRDIEAFWGVADATMYRDESWHFTRLGRHLERAQLVSSLLLAHLAAEAGGGPDGAASDPEWISLLRACQAFDAYTRTHGFEIRAERVLDLLVAAPRAPRALCRALDACAESLDGIGLGPVAAADAAARQAAGQLAAGLGADWRRAGDAQAVLGETLARCRDLPSRVMTAFVDYPVDGLPAD